MAIQRFKRVLKQQQLGLAVDCGSLCPFGVEGRTYFQPQGIFVHAQITGGTNDFTTGFLDNDKRHRPAKTLFGQGGVEIGFDTVRVRNRSIE